MSSSISRTQFSTQGFAVAESETPTQILGVNYAASAAVAVTGGGRREQRSHGSIPIGLAALVAGFALLWVGLVLNDIVEAVCRVVIGLLAVLLALRAVEDFKRQHIPLAVFYAVVAIGFALFAAIGPVDRIDKLVVVLAAL